MEKDINRNKKRICISTLDLASIGGTRSMATFVYNEALKHFDPFFVYNIIPGLRSIEKDITLWGFIKGIPPKAKKEEFASMRSIGIERVLPEFEFFNYVFNIKQWEEVMNSSNIFFAVGGSNNCALPFVFLNRNFSLWVATTLYEDRKDRIKKESFLSKVRHYLSLPILLYFEKIVFEKAQKILALSAYTKNKIVEKYKINSKKIEIVSFPIKKEEFYPIEYHQRKNDYLLFTGRLNDERKNIPLLLKAFSKIKKKHPSCKLKLVGGKYSKKLSQIANELKIQNSVEVYNLVPYPQLIEHYQHAAVFVIPSFQEGLCISGLEALACGIPVISTKCGGAEDFIKGDYNGYLVENNNVETLAAAISNFLSFSHEKRKKLSENARSYILENHCTEKIWPKFLECFNLSQ